MIAMFGHSWYVFECLSTPFDLIFQIGDIIWNFCCSQSFWFSSADVFPLSQILCHRWSYLNFFYHFIGFYRSSPGLYCYLWFGRSYYAYKNKNEIFQLHIWKSLQNVFEWRNLLLIILYSIKAGYYLIFGYNSTAVTREPYVYCMDHTVWLLHVYSIYSVCLISVFDSVLMCQNCSGYLFWSKITWKHHHLRRLVQKLLYWLLRDVSTQ